MQGTSTRFDKIVLECKLGRCLKPHETVEHANQDRQNNNVANLLARGKLFQANSQRPGRLSPDTNMRGVHLYRGYYVANVRELCMDGPTISTTKRKYFSIEKLGKKQALEAAKGWREHFALTRGMLFD